DAIDRRIVMEQYPVPLHRGESVGVSGLLFQLPGYLRNVVANATVDLLVTGKALPHLGQEGAGWLFPIIGVNGPGPVLHTGDEVLVEMSITGHSFQGALIDLRRAEPVLGFATVGRPEVVKMMVMRNERITFGKQMTMPGEGRFCFLELSGRAELGDEPLNV